MFFQICFSLVGN